MTILGRVKNKKIQIQRFFKKDFEKLEGKEIEITPVEGSKTQQQLRYLWGVVYKIVSDETGFTPEEVSDIYKKKFLAYEKEYKGKVYKLTKGLSGLKKSEMMTFIDSVIKHATVELNLIVPEPDPEFLYDYE